MILNLTGLFCTSRGQHSPYSNSKKTFHKFQATLFDQINLGASFSGFLPQSHMLVDLSNLQLQENLQCSLLILFNFETEGRYAERQSTGGSWPPGKFFYQVERRFHGGELPSHSDMLSTYDQKEPAISYRWTSWVWETTGWSCRGIYRIYTPI